MKGKLVIGCDKTLNFCVEEKERRVLFGHLISDLHSKNVVFSIAIERIGNLSISGNVCECLHISSSK